MTATQEQLAKLAALVNAPGLWEYPALDTPAGDDVFGMPLMRWLQENYFNPSIVGLDFGYTSKFMFAADCFNMESMRRTNNFYDDTATLALLRACQSAGVEEICEIFGKGE